MYCFALTVSPVNVIGLCFKKKKVCTLGCRLNVLTTHKFSSVWGRLVAPKSERITSHCFGPLSPPFGEVALLPRFYTCFMNIHERVGRAGVEFHSWRLRACVGSVDSRVGCCCRCWRTDFILSAALSLEDRALLNWRSVFWAWQQLENTENWKYTSGSCCGTRKITCRKMDII